MLLLPWRPKVLRSCDMEHVMLHLIFSLPHAWGGTTHSGTLPLLFDSRDFSVRLTQTNRIWGSLRSSNHDFKQHIQNGFNWWREMFIIELQVSVPSRP